MMGDTSVPPSISSNGIPPYLMLVSAASRWTFRTSKIPKTSACQLSSAGLLLLLPCHPLDMPW